MFLFSQSHCLKTKINLQRIPPGNLGYVLGIISSLEMLFALVNGSARLSISVAIGVSEIHSGTVQEQVPEQISGMQLAPEKCPGTLRHFSGMELAQKIVQEVLRNLFLNSSGTVPGWISETPIATEMLKRADAINYRDPTMNPIEIDFVVCKRLHVARFASLFLYYTPFFIIIDKSKV